MNAPASSSLPGTAATPSLPTPVFLAELEKLLEQFGTRPVRLSELLEATQGRGYHLVLVLIALPFVGPIPLPGFSIPFGLVVCLLGLRLAMDRHSWLPRRLLERPVPADAIAKGVRAAMRIMRGIEYFLRPRLGFVPNNPLCGRIAGTLIAVSGVMLMLPFPLPFSNSLPAWTVILLAAGALGRDGLFFFAGCGSFALSVAFFTAVAYGGAELIQQLQRMFPWN